ncbi:hypothetical protein [Ruminococcus sp. 5_1_39BFAA]
MEKSEIVGYEPLVNDLKQLTKSTQVSKIIIDIGVESGDAA